MCYFVWHPAVRRGNSQHSPHPSTKLGFRPTSSSKPTSKPPGWSMSTETPGQFRKKEGRGYAWVLSDATSPKACYVCAISRGAVHAQNLIGPDFTGIRISDDYAPYRGETLPGSQQLCWAHLYRCIRDLRYNDKPAGRAITFTSPIGTVTLPPSTGTYGCIWPSRMTKVFVGPKLPEALGTDSQVSYDEILPGSQPANPRKLIQLKTQLIRAGKNSTLYLPAREYAVRQ